MNVYQLPVVNQSTTAHLDLTVRREGLQMWSPIASDCPGHVAERLRQSDRAHIADC